MFGKADTSVLMGIDGRKVTVEADFGDGLPTFEMVGFLGSEVKEAKERVRSAIRNSGIYMNPGRLTVNLSPANVRKQGNSFDLAIAIAILVAYGVIPEEKVTDYAFIGELSLNGSVRPIEGTLSHVMTAREEKKKGCIVPLENESEGKIFSDIEIIGVSSLSETITYLLSPETYISSPPSPVVIEKPILPDFTDVKGQELVKRAAVVSSAGMHGFLMVGPPGSGKTLTAKRIPTILPPLDEKESMECTKIHSVAGTLPPGSGLIRIRPFRSPHHTISMNGLVGGGSVPRPGEMSLAHNGVLFLDELPEFSKTTLEVMRQPLEDGKVVISRVQGSYVFPTRVMLVAAMNPCRCGYYPDRSRCRCSEADVKKYLSRISKPLLDRMDITVEVGRVRVEDIESNKPGLSSDEMRKMVLKARRIQQERFIGKGIRYNSELSGKMLNEFCSLSPSSRMLLKEAFDSLGLSARAHDRILKVARTIGDLDESKDIKEKHLAEAISYRALDRKFFGEIYR